MTKHKTPPPSPSKTRLLCGIPQNNFIAVVASILLEISGKNNSKAQFQKGSSFTCELGKLKKYILKFKIKFSTNNLF